MRWIRSQASGAIVISTTLSLCGCNDLHSPTENQQGKLTAGHRVKGDFDGDSIADFTVYRPSTGTWFMKSGPTPDAPTSSVNWGTAEDIPVAEDYDGDGKYDVAVFRPSILQWLINGSTEGWKAIRWGELGDIPVPADYDGDGRADAAIWRPSTGTWWVTLSGGGTITRQWGQAGDIPIPGKWDTDAKADFIVYRPSGGNWLVFGTVTNAPLPAVQWGAPEDRPMLVNYHDMSIPFFDSLESAPAVYRPSTHEIYTPGATTSAQNLGTLDGTEVPVIAPYGYFPGSWAAGFPTTALWNPTTGIFSAPFAAQMQWGAPGDINALALPQRIPLPPCGMQGMTCCTEGNQCQSSALACQNNVCNPCGGQSQICCNGGGCGGGLTCQSNVCKPPCGAQNQTCCDGGGCGAGLTCQSNVCKPPCGEQNQACCSGGGCGTGLTCQSNVCKPPCGGQNQACCPGNSCGTALTCQSGLCNVPTCGHTGQICCGAGMCFPRATPGGGFGGYNSCDGQHCLACGNPGESCCFHPVTNQPPDCLNGGVDGCNPDTGRCF